MWFIYGNKDFLRSFLTKRFDEDAKGGRKVSMLPRCPADALTCLRSHRSMTRKGEVCT